MAEDVRAELRSWGRRHRKLGAERGRLVAHALAAGISKSEIHRVTGLARTTIDRIASQAWSTTDDLH